MTGKFVVIEGDDYAGKTTFVEYLKERHPEYVYNREPSGKIREILLANDGREIDPLTRFHLFWASRAENLNKIIIPALETGKVVVSDRFDASTFAYQVGGDGRRDLEVLFWQTRKLHLESVSISYIFFNIPLFVANRRRKNRKGEKNHFDNQLAAYRKEVSNFYWVFFRNKQVKKDSHSFNSDKPRQQMLAEAYELFQSLVP